MAYLACPFAFLFCQLLLDGGDVVPAAQHFLTQRSWLHKGFFGRLATKHPQQRLPVLGADCDQINASSVIVAEKASAVRKRQCSVVVRVLLFLFHSRKDTNSTETALLSPSCFFRQALRYLPRKGTAPSGLVVQSVKRLRGIFIFSLVSFLTG